jgi:phosphatidylglycerophosphate synthase
MKRLADLLTLGRFFISLGIMALGVFGGAKTLPTVLMLVLLGWMTDALDGPLARRARPRRTTRVGEHDFTIDVFMVVALLWYLTAIGVAPWLGALAYLVVAGVSILCVREQAVALAFMAPVDALFLHTGWRLAPTETRLVLLYLAATLILDWHRFCYVVSVFVDGMRMVFHVGDKRRF